VQEPAINFTELSAEEIVASGEISLEEFVQFMETSPKLESREFRFLKVPQLFFDDGFDNTWVGWNEVAPTIGTLFPSGETKSWQVSEVKRVEIADSNNFDVQGKLAKDDPDSCGDSFELRIDRRENTISGWFFVDNIVIAIEPTAVGINVAADGSRAHVTFISPEMKSHEEDEDSENVEPPKAKISKDPPSKLKSTDLEFGIMILCSYRVAFGKSEVALKDLADRLVREINTALAQTYIEVKIVLVGQEGDSNPIKTCYEESSSTENDYKNLLFGHEQLDEYRAIRDEEQVHFMALLVDNKKQGEATLKPEQYQAAVFAADIGPFSKKQFSFAHETSHLLGAMHESKFSLQDHAPDTSEYDAYCKEGSYYCCWQSLTGRERYGPATEKHQRQRKLIFSNSEGFATAGVAVQSSANSQNRDNVIKHINDYISKESFFN
jgi:hypothetical protein